MLGQLPDFRLERYFARWEFTAPYLLCASDIEGLKLLELLALADTETAALWEGLSLGYTESAGLPLLRREIATLYNSVAADDVLVFAGAEEAILVALSSLLGAGEHAIVTWPCYQSLEEVVRGAGATVSRWELREADRWQPDPEALCALLRDNTRLIVANFPHNPTGAMPDRAAWDEIVSIAREAGAWLFADEVYRGLEYDPAHRLPTAVDIYERGVSLGVMSKAWALAGLRIGWIACRDPSALQRMATRKDWTTICSSAPSEVLALMGLRARAAIVERNRAIIRENLALLDPFFERHGDRLRWVRPRVGCIGFPRLIGESVDGFAERLVEREGVLLLPGTTYGHAGNHFRLGFGRRNMPEALARLERFMQA
jgi:aspartate/methionine/tyrosine aminotransferase